MSNQVNIHRVKLTPAQIKSCASVPIQLLPPPGGGRYYNFITSSAAIKRLPSTTSYNFSASDLVITIGRPTTDNIVADIDTTDINSNAGIEETFIAFFPDIKLDINQAIYLSCD